MNGCHPGDAGAGLGCSGPPTGRLASFRPVPGSVLGLLSCACLGGNPELLGVLDIRQRWIKAEVFSWH